MKELIDIFKIFLLAIENPNELKLIQVIHSKARFEYPYHIPGRPEKIEGVIDIIDYIINRDFLTSYKEPDYLELTPSGMIIAEMMAEETYQVTHKTFEQHLLCKVKITDNKISYYQEFYNPITRMEGLLNLDKRPFM